MNKSNPETFKSKNVSFGAILTFSKLTDAAALLNFKEPKSHPI